MLFAGYGDLFMPVYPVDGPELGVNAPSPMPPMVSARRRPVDGRHPALLGFPPPLSDDVRTTSTSKPALTTSSLTTRTASTVKTAPAPTSPTSTSIGPAAIPTAPAPTPAPPLTPMPLPPASADSLPQPVDPYAATPPDTLSRKRPWWIWALIGTGAAAGTIGIVLLSRRDDGGRRRARR